VNDGLALLGGWAGWLLFVGVLTWLVAVRRTDHDHHTGSGGDGDASPPSAASRNDRPGSSERQV
jgi:hypothetical protein